MVIKLPEASRVRASIPDDVFYGNRAMILRSESRSALRLYLTELRIAVDEAIRTFDR